MCGWDPPAIQHLLDQGLSKTAIAQRLGWADGRLRCQSVRDI